MSGGHFQSVPYAQSKLRTLANEIESDATLTELIGAERRKEFAVFIGHVAEMVELLDKHAAGDMDDERFSLAMTGLLSFELNSALYRLGLLQRNADFALWAKKKDQP